MCVRMCASVSVDYYSRATGYDVACDLRAIDINSFSVTNARNNEIAILKRRVRTQVSLREVRHDHVISNNC